MSIKVPNLKETISLALKVIARFPLIVLCAVVGTSLSIYCLEHEAMPAETEMAFYQLLKVVYAGVPLFLALKLLTEALSKKVYGIIIHFCGVAFLLIYYYLQPEKPFFLSEVKYTLLIAFLHLLVSFAPFLVKNEPKGFWNFNINVLTHFLTSIVFSGIFYVGLALAMAAIHKLFNVYIHSSTYVELAVVIYGIFSVVYFLGGVPERSQLVEDEVYSQGLSILVQYILGPLVVIYSIILYLYTAKIIVKWEWPNGWIAYLFISYAVLGLLTYLMAYPISRQASKSWVKYFLKTFFISLLPLVVVLFLAVYRRVSEYGLTENRYFLYAIDLWLVGIAIYFLISKSRNIIVIPISLAVLIAVTSVGPLGAFAVSDNAQFERLEIYLTKQRESENLSFQERKNVSSIMMYFHKRKKLDYVQPLFNADVKSLEQTVDVGVISKLLSEYNLKELTKWATEDMEQSERVTANLSANVVNYVDVSGYELFVNADTYNDSVTHEEDGDYIVNIDGKRYVLPAYEFYEKMGEKYKGQTKYRLDAEELSYEGETEDISYKIYFEALYLKSTDNHWFKIGSDELKIFIHKKR